MVTKRKQYGKDKGVGEEGGPVSLCSGECKVQIRKFRRTSETKIETSGEECPALSDEEFNVWMKRVYPDTLLEPYCQEGCHCETPSIPDDDPEWKKKRWVKQPIEDRFQFRKILGGGPDMPFLFCTYTVSGAIEKKSIIVVGTCD